MIKAVGLYAIAGVVGGSFALVLADVLGFARERWLSRYVWGCAVLGLLAAPLFFLLQVGGVSQSGLAGMVDPVMGGIVLGSSHGTVLAWRLTGFAMELATGFLLSPSAAPTQRRAGYLMATAAAVVLCSSFVLTGHVSTLPAIVRVLLVLHVLAVFLWTGALYPLWRLSNGSDLRQVHRLMSCFGRFAVAIVLVLLVAGVVLVSQLVESAADLVTTAYGFTLLLKLLGVTGLLLLGGLNKLVLVPALLAKGSATALRRSIGFEMTAAVYVFVLTSWLTTVTGPHAG